MVGSADRRGSVKDGALILVHHNTLIYTLVKDVKGRKTKNLFIDEGAQNGDVRYGIWGPCMEK